MESVSEKTDSINPKKFSDGGTNGRGKVSAGFGNPAGEGQVNVKFILESCLFARTSCG